MASISTAKIVRNATITLGPSLVNKSGRCQEHASTYIGDVVIAISAHRTIVGQRVLASGPIRAGQARSRRDSVHSLVMCVQALAQLDGKSSRSGLAGVPSG